jgi:phosphoglycolate phosphatase
MRSLPGHVIFDLDGTLADSSQGILWSFRATLEEIGLEAHPDVLGQLIGPPLGDSFRILGVEESDIDDVVARYREYYAQRGVYEAQLYDGVADALEHLSEQGVGLAVATAKRVDFAHQMLRALGIAHHFDQIAGASVDLRITAKYDIMALVLQEWGSGDENDTWMIGDRHYDMVAARRHEVTAVGALWGFGSADELTSAGAHWLVSSPRRLVEPEEEGGSAVCLLEEVCEICGSILDESHAGATHGPNAQ